MPLITHHDNYVPTHTHTSRVILDVVGNMAQNDRLASLLFRTPHDVLEKGNYTHKSCFLSVYVLISSGVLTLL
jgi:hypothetical protein